MQAATPGRGCPNYGSTKAPSRTTRRGSATNGQPSPAGSGQGTCAAQGLSHQWAAFTPRAVQPHGQGQYQEVGQSAAHQQGRAVRHQGPLQPLGQDRELEQGCAGGRSVVLGNWWPWACVPWDGYLEEEPSKTRSGLKQGGATAPD